MPVPSLKVLVVDDEPNIRTLLSMVLERLGHKSQEAAEGREALAILERWSCDLIITDLRMPGMSGHALLRELRSRGNRVPAIVITGYLPDISQEEAAGLMVSVVLAKPFSVSELAAALNRVYEQELTIA
jgi:CheY-like chemotaxis protein